MKIITLDFETYYTKEFGFSKLTTEEYVRHPDFEVIGVSAQVGDGEPVWYTGTHKEIRKYLDDYKLHNHVVVAHNAAFDMAVLNWRFHIRPKKIIDTLSMARALHGTEVGGSLKALAEFYKVGAKGTEVVDAMGLRRLDFTKEQLDAYGKYCSNDTRLTYEIFLKMLPDFPKSELELIDLTIRMFTEPEIMLDVDALAAHLRQVKAKKAALLAVTAFEQADIMSNNKFAELLKELNVVPPTKISPTTGKETYAFAKTDPGMMALAESEDIQVQALVAARLGIRSTLEESRTERFIAIGERGALPVPLRYYAAHTGRWGGQDAINLQNLPRSSPLKKAMFAPEGFVFCDVDSSQIEARTLAWLAGQEDLVHIFEKNNEEIAAGIPKSQHQHDPYKIMASKIYGVDSVQVTDRQRFFGKTVILGCGYGLGGKTFQKQLAVQKVDIPLDECYRIIEIYRETNYRIPELWKAADRAIHAIIGDTYYEFGTGGIIKVEGKKGIRLPNGLYIKYPNLRWTETRHGTRFMYDTKRGRAVIPTTLHGPKIVENVCQAFARIIIGDQMRVVAKKYKVVMTVHDAIGCVIPEEEADTGLEFVQMCMKLRPEWAPDLPLNCEGGYGESYGDCK
jgi:DNA polymerase